MEITIGPRILLAKTCLRCGLFKQAREYAKVAADYWNSYCHKCKNLMGRPGMRQHQERAQDVAVRHRQPWTDRDIERLLEMSERGLSGPQMALALNRTVYSVYTMKNKLFKEQR